MKILAGPFDFHELPKCIVKEKNIKKVTPGASKRQRRDVIKYMRRCIDYASGLYHVNVDKEAEHGFGELPEGTEFWHLSIKRHDKEPMNDWREMQAIKTAICGPKAEAVQLYPAEDRVVDTSNQYHLYVLVGARFPFGFQSGARTDKDHGGTKQRAGSGGKSADHWTP